MRYVALILLFFISLEGVTNYIYLFYCEELKL